METVSHRPIQDASPVDFKLHHYQNGPGLGRSGLAYPLSRMTPNSSSPDLLSLKVPSCKASIGRLMS
jgi:hypothetical protein